MKVLFILFVVMPILEMVVLIKVGSAIGALPTVAMVLLTAMIGLALLKQQGLSTLLRARQRMDEGQMPVSEMVEGIFLAVGGALLLTPGFITDAFGFACLIPGLRQLLIAAGLKVLGPRVVVTGFQTSETHFRQGPEGKETIDGEFHRHDSASQDRLNR